MSRKGKNNRVLTYTTIKSIKDLETVIKGRKYPPGSVAFHMKKNNPKKASHAMFVGNMTRNNIFFWAHSSNRNGEDTKGYGFRDMLKNDSDRCITVFKINYSYKWRT